jgi:hypothetical protein
MLSSAERTGSAIVVLGDFIPKMFHPLWFRELKLLGKEEVEASVESADFLIADQVAQFTVSGFAFNITPDRFQITTEREDLFEPLRDLVQGTLASLDQAPVTALGMNWLGHFRCASEATWHAAGDKLTPKDFWKSIWSGRPGMMDVTMRLDRTDSFKGFINVAVQPSVPVKFGLYFAVNDHIDLKAEAGTFRAANLSAIVKDEYAKSRDRARSLFQGLYDHLIKNV